MSAEPLLHELGGRQPCLDALRWRHGPVYVHDLGIQQLESQIYGWSVRHRLRLGSAVGGDVPNRRRRVERSSGGVGATAPPGTPGSATQRPPPAPARRGIGPRGGTGRFNAPRCKRHGIVGDPGRPGTPRRCCRLYDGPSNLARGRRPAYLLPVAPSLRGAGRRHARGAMEGRWGCDAGSLRLRWVQPSQDRARNERRDCVERRADRWCVPRGTAAVFRCAAAGARSSRA